MSVACPLLRLIHLCRLTTNSRQVHVVANEATQGIDPDGSEKIMEEAHVIPLWQGINPADNDSKW